MDNAGSIRLISLYRKRAKRYDWTTLLLYFVGFRHWTYRKRAIQLLALRQGDGRDREYIFDRVPKDLAVETYPLWTSKLDQRFIAESVLRIRMLN